jgi:hypothetical protein
MTGPEQPRLGKLHFMTKEESRDEGRRPELTGILALPEAIVIEERKRCQEPLMSLEW